MSISVQRASDLATSHRMRDALSHGRRAGRYWVLIGSVLVSFLAGARTAEAQEATRPRRYENALLAGFVGLDFGARQLHYRDRVSNANLRPYDLPDGALFPVAPGLAAAAEVFPLTNTDLPVIRDLGVTARANYNFVSSRVGDVSPKTRWFGWELNIRERILLGPSRSAPLIGLELGLGRQAFRFTAPGAAQDILPSVDYYYFRFGADGRIPIGPLNLLVGVAYRHLQSRIGPSGATVPAAGALGEHFPKAKFAGLDGKLGAALPLTDYLEARLVLNYVRYWADLNPEPGATYVAAGATEQMLNADLGVAAFF